MSDQISKETQIRLEKNSYDYGYQTDPSIFGTGTKVSYRKIQKYLGTNCTFEVCTRYFIKENRTVLQPTYTTSIGQVPIYKSILFLALSPY